MGNSSGKGVKAAGAVAAKRVYPKTPGSPAKAASPFASSFDNHDPADVEMARAQLAAEQALDDRAAAAAEAARTTVASRQVQQDSHIDYNLVQRVGKLSLDRMSSPSAHMDNAPIDRVSPAASSRRMPQKIVFNEIDPRSGIEQPGFLTAEQVETMFLLHKKNPDTWQSDKLSERLLVTPEQVDRILRHYDLFTGPSMESKAGSDKASEAAASGSKSTRNSGPQQ